MKKVLKISALLLAIVLIGLLVNLTLETYGNPYIKHLAKGWAQDYIAVNYPDSDLIISDVGFNFKDDTYIAHIKSPTSIDTHFSLAFNKNGECTEDYYDYVINKYNTFDRLNMAYRSMVDEVFKDLENDSEKGYVFAELNIVKDFDEYIDFYPYVDYYLLNELVIDMEYDINSLADKYGVIKCNLIVDEVSVDSLAKNLKLVQAKLDAADVNYAYFDITIRNNDSHKYLSIKFFPKDLIASENLYEELEKAIALDEAYFATIEK